MYCWDACFKSVLLILLATILNSVLVEDIALSVNVFKAVLNIFLRNTLKPNLYLPVV